VVDDTEISPVEVGIFNGVDFNHVFWGGKNTTFQKSIAEAAGLRNQFRQLFMIDSMNRITSKNYLLSF
jgi:hypothetical protein